MEGDGGGGHGLMDTVYKWNEGRNKHKPLSLWFHRGQCPCKVSFPSSQIDAHPWKPTKKESGEKDVL